MSADEEITVHIKSAGDKKYDLKVSKSLTIGEFKKQIETESDIPHDKQRLIYSGRVLRDGETLASYKVQNDHTIHLVRSAGASKSASSAGASAASSSNPQQSSTAAASESNNIPTNISAGTSASDPLAGLTGARYAGYGVNLPGADMFGPDGGLNPNEDQISSMMDSPMFQEMMNSMLSNPQMLDSMINQNPMLRSMGPQAREILQSPYFRQMMSNPQMLRQAMDMQRAMGGSNPFGGAAGGAGTSFPAPGPASNSESTGNDNSGTAASDSSNNNSNSNSTANSQNPFAAMFPGGTPQLPPFGLFGQPPASGAASNNGGANAASNPLFNPELLASMFGGAGAGANAAPADNRPPEERYEQQLRQLNDMGFTDFDRNVSALRRSGGSVQGAIDALLDGSI